MLMRLESDVSLGLRQDWDWSSPRHGSSKTARVGRRPLSRRLWRATGSVGLASLKATVVSPWSDAAGQSVVSMTQTDLGPGGTVNLQAQLLVPEQPERQLMPYLVVLTGRTQAPPSKPFTVAIPVDLLTVTP